MFILFTKVFSRFSPHLFLFLMIVTRYSDKTLSLFFGGHPQLLYTQLCSFGFFGVFFVFKVFFFF